MSLDIYLVMPHPLVSRIEGMKTVDIKLLWGEMTAQEMRTAKAILSWAGRELEKHEEEKCVFTTNITHNLGKMAQEAGIYSCVWRPDELGIKSARKMIPLLIAGIQLLRKNPKKFKKFDDPDGWGTYKDFVPFLEEYLQACKDYPEAIIEVSR